MTFPTWHEPVRLLEEGTGPATNQQRDLARTVGLTLVGTEPQGVAAVLLEEHLQPLILGTESERATDRQRAFLVELGSRVADDAGLTKRTASAWIEHHLALRSIDCLKRLALARDDAVIKRTRWRHPETGRLCEALDYAIVSSIGANGMVYFRGGNGKCGWPSSLARAATRIRRDVGGHVVCTWFGGGRCAWFGWVGMAAGAGGSVRPLGSGWGWSRGAWFVVAG